MTLSPQQLLLLVLLTLVWGFNWPVMKLGVTELPPLTFRALSMWFGLPVLYAAVRLMKVDLRVPRHHWRELAGLTLTNMLLWHVVAIIAVQALSSGRAAILGYTMPIFSALWGFALWNQRLTLRQLGGVVAAAIGVALLVWHELAHMAGRPWAALGMLFAAATWALGTQQLRHTRILAPTMALSWWMTVLTMAGMTLVAVLFEHDRWHWPSFAAWGTIGYNAVMIFGFAQPVWFVLARGLPPAASTLSVMMIPVLGALFGALWLRETLHWQDGAALVLMGTAIASVLWPQRRPAAEATG